MQPRNMTSASPPASYFYSPYDSSVGASAGSIRQKEVQRSLSQKTSRESQPLDQFVVKHAPPDVSIRPTSLTDSVDPDDLERQSLKLLILHPNRLEDFYRGSRSPAPQVDIDVTQALPPNFLRFSAWNKPYDTESPETLSEDDPKSSSVRTASIDNDADDESFFDVTTSLIPHLQPSADDHQNTLRERAWQQLRREVETHFSESEFLNSDAFNTALHHWVSQFSCALNPEKITTALRGNAAGIQQADAFLNQLTGFMAKYQVAETLTATNPEKVFEHLDDRCQALQALLVYRHKLVSETTEENYARTVETLDLLIQKTLIQQFGDVLRTKTGLDINRNEPDYEHFSRLADIAGHATPADGLDSYILSEAQNHPSGDLATLISLDAWLTDDNDTPNMVIWSLGAALLPEFNTLDEKFQLSPFRWTPDERDKSDAQESPVPSQKDNHRHVRFKDRSHVIPSQQTESAESPTPIEDITDLQRADLPSHFAVQYFDKLHEIRHRLEQSPQSQTDNHARSLLNEGQMYAQKAVNVKAKMEAFLKENQSEERASEQVQEKLRNYRKAIISHSNSALGYMDSLMDKEHATQLTKEARKKWTSNLSFIKVGLINEKTFLQNHEEYLARTVVKSMQPRRSMAHDKTVHQYRESSSSTLKNKSDKPSVKEPIVSATLTPNSPLRGLPKTSDHISALSALTRHYHQAMEVPFKPPAEFLFALLMMTDPRVMLPLRVRMENEQVPDFMITSWNQRMKEIMLEHCAQRVVSEMNKKMHVQLEETLGDTHPTPFFPKEGLQQKQRKKYFLTYKPWSKNS